MYTNLGCEVDSLYNTHGFLYIFITAICFKVHLLNITMTCGTPTIERTCKCISAGN